MNLFTKQKQTHRHRQGAYVYQGKGWVRGIVSEFGTDTYTLLCLTQIASDDRESACDVGDLGSILIWEDLLEKGLATQLQCSCLENPHGQRSLADYSPWGRKESDRTERLSTAQPIRTYCIVQRTLLHIM